MSTPNRLQAQPFPNTTHLSPELQAALRDDVDRMARAAFAAQGVNAFFGSKRAAAFHEAAHTLVYLIEGDRVDRVAIWPVSFRGSVTWIGETIAGQPWKVTSASPLDEILRRIRIVLAGVVGELLGEGRDFRAGSSLDEVALARALAAIAALKTGRSARAVLEDQAESVRSILQERRKDVSAVASALMRRNRISGRRLRRLLGGVAS